MRATAKAMKSARRLRRELSLPEQLLWRLLRQHRGHVRFRRQYAMGPYVADFYCATAKMVIEIDGAGHDHRFEHDVVRDAYIESFGLRVIRISAKDVLADPEAVADGLVRSVEGLAGPSTTQLR